MIFILLENINLLSMIDWFQPVARLWWGPCLPWQAAVPHLEKLSKLKLLIPSYSDEATGCEAHTSNRLSTKI